MALWHYLFSISGEIEQFPGLEKAGFDLTALLFHFSYKIKSEKVHGILEFRTFEKSQNPFVTDLTLLRYFFTFHKVKSDFNFFKKVEKLGASRGGPHAIPRLRQSGAYDSRPFF